MRSRYCFKYGYNLLMAKHTFNHLSINVSDFYYRIKLVQVQANIDIVLLYQTYNLNLELKHTDSEPQLSLIFWALVPIWSFHSSTLVHNQEPLNNYYLISYPRRVPWLFIWKTWIVDEGNNKFISTQLKDTILNFYHQWYCNGDWNRNSTLTMTNLRWIGLISRWLFNENWSVWVLAVW